MAAVNHNCANCNKPIIDGLRVYLLQVTVRDRETYPAGSQRVCCSKTCVRAMLVRL